MSRDVFSDNPLEQVVRGHLWIESGLITLIEAALPFPDRVDLARFTFVHKLDLAAAHGFLRPQDIPAFRRLNAIRNKVAHNLDAELREQDLSDLVNSFGEVTRQTFDQYLAEAGLVEAPWGKRFSVAILHLVLTLDVEHERFQDHRNAVLRTNEQLRASAEKLRRYLQTNPRARDILTRLGGPDLASGESSYGDRSQTAEIGKDAERRR